MEYNWLSTSKNGKHRTAQASRVSHLHAGHCLNLITELLLQGKFILGSFLDVTIYWYIIQIQVTDSVYTDLVYERRHRMYTGKSVWQTVVYYLVIKGISRLEIFRGNIYLSDILIRNAHVFTWHTLGRNKSFKDPFTQFKMYHRG